MTDNVEDTPAAALPTPAAPTTAEDPDPTRSNRRKACDLCFTKKIKCDMLKPDCSNCLLYHAKCRTTIIRRKANPPKVRAAEAPLQTQNGDSGALESRLAKIEGQLQQVLGAMATQRELEKSSSSPSTSGSDSNSHVNSSSSQATTPFTGFANTRAQPTNTAAKLPILEPVQAFFYEDTEASEMRLPARQELLPIVHHFFANFNSVIPIFSRPAFMRLLNGWESRPHDKVVWAAIQIVIALGLRTPRPGTVDSGFEYTSMAHRCMLNAQSVVSELVTRNEDLLGIQVLLGIVMLFQDTKDPTPASVLIGAAVRLAHRLQLQSRDAVYNNSDEETLQRSRVFWIAYTLEKDICLRAKTPSVQLDADIDLPLPPRISPDGAGLIWTRDGRTHLNFFRTRLELAHIQGKCYDLLFSNRALKVKGMERHERVARLQDMLDKWYDRIPMAFQMENVSVMVGHGELVQMTKMHHAYLLVEIMTHGVYSNNADWVQRISAMSKLAMKDFALSRDKYKPCQDDQHAPLPPGWTKCVEVTRACMKLFQYCTPTESLLWQCSCAHYSGLIILLSNMILYPGHSYVSVDQSLVDRAMPLLDSMVELVQDEQFASLRVIVRELNDKASLSVEGAAHRMGDDSVFQGFDEVDQSTLDFFGSTQALDLLPLDSEVAPLEFLAADGFEGPFGGFGALDDPEMGRGQDASQIMELPSFLL